MEQGGSPRPASRPTDLYLHMMQTLRDALDARGYDTLTPVQEAVTAPELSERDLLVSAQTGSGKTVGFGLAIGPTILDDDGALPGEVLYRVNAGGAEVAAGKP